MSSAFDSVMQIDENAGNMPMNALTYRIDELPARNEDREELHFVETIVGRRGSLRGILSLVDAVAPTNTTVLIAGETGTGKEVIARGVILSKDGVFKPAPLESYQRLEPEISNPTLEDKVRREILTACRRANWKLGGPRGAAARLGLKRTTLFYKMKRLGIAPPADD
jgi:transcriptional regulator with GAF, ATPase, and Fis domain